MEWSPLGWYEALSLAEGRLFSISTARCRHHSFKSARQSGWSSHFGRPQSWETCCQCQRHLLLPSSSTSTHPAYAQYRVCSNTGACLCDALSRLLQHLFAMAPKTISNKLQRTLNAAAHVLNGTGSLTAAWHSWHMPSFTGSTYLSVSSTNSPWSRVAFWKVLLISIWRRHCISVSATASRHHLRSTPVISSQYCPTVGVCGLVVRVSDS